MTRRAAEGWSRSSAGGGVEGGPQGAVEGPQATHRAVKGP